MPDKELEVRVKNCTGRQCRKTNRTTQQVFWKKQRVICTDVSDSAMHKSSLTISLRLKLEEELPYINL